MSTAFEKELAHYGPASPPQPWSLASARGYCAALVRNSYENFTVVSLLLPRRLIPHFQAIYAWCRWADNLGDETGAAALSLLDWWQRELQACYQGIATHPVTIALSATVQEFAIPTTPFLALLQAFRRDQTQKEYATFAELLQYCHHSADPVGELVLYLGKAHTPENVQLSNAICTGLQLANFWQDLRRDADELGRSYLPAEDCLRFGYTREAYNRRETNAAFLALTKFQVERTQSLFDMGRPLLAKLPLDIRLDVELFIRGGEATLRGIIRQRYNVWERRPTISKIEKMTLLAQALAGKLLLWLRRNDSA